MPHPPCCLPHARAASITSILAGQPGKVGAVNGAALASTFTGLSGLAIAPNGDVFAADGILCQVGPLPTSHAALCARYTSYPLDNLTLAHCMGLGGSSVVLGPKSPPTMALRPC